MAAIAPDAFEAWMAGLEERHLSRLRFAEVSRALRALSSAYVERRDRLAHGAALDGGGKRAAFALFYGPLHFLAVREIVARLPLANGPIDTVADLGCGTGAAGAAWAVALAGRATAQRASREDPASDGPQQRDRVDSAPAEPRPRTRREGPASAGFQRVPQIVGIDRHQWAVAEAAWTYRLFGLRGRTVQDDGARAPIPIRRAGLLAAFLVNELGEDARARMQRRLIDAAHRGAVVLVVEPIGRRAVPWWDAWAEVFVDAGGRADEWRFDVDLPDIVRRLDRAAGLSHDELTARTLFLDRGSGERQPATGGLPESG